MLNDLEGRAGPPAATHQHWGLQASRPPQSLLAPAWSAFPRAPSVTWGLVWKLHSLGRRKERKKIYYGVTVHWMLQRCHLFECDTRSSPPTCSWQCWERNWPNFQPFSWGPLCVWVCTHMCVLPTYHVVPGGNGGGAPPATHGNWPFCHLSILLLTGSRCLLRFFMTKAHDICNFIKWKTNPDKI